MRDIVVLLYLKPVQFPAVCVVALTGVISGKRKPGKHGVERRNMMIFAHFHSL